MPEDKHHTRPAPTPLPAEPGNAERDRGGSQTPDKGERVVEIQEIGYALETLLREAPARARAIFRHLDVALRDEIQSSWRNRVPWSRVLQALASEPPVPSHQAPVGADLAQPPPATAATSVRPPAVPRPDIPAALAAGPRIGLEPRIR